MRQVWRRLRRDALDEQDTGKENPSHAARSGNEPEARDLTKNPERAFAKPPSGKKGLLRPGVICHKENLRLRQKQNTAQIGINRLAIRKDSIQKASRWR
jgi:hypothetical protein